MAEDTDLPVARLRARDLHLVRIDPLVESRQAVSAGGITARGHRQAVASGRDDARVVDRLAGGIEHPAEIARPLVRTRADLVLPSIPVGARQQWCRQQYDSKQREPDGELHGAKRTPVPENKKPRHSFEPGVFRLLNWPGGNLLSHAQLHT